MQFKWDNKNTTRFLRLYRKHRCLWNQYDAEYLNCNVKNKAFIDIIEELNVPGLGITDCLRQLKLIGKKWKFEHRRSVQCSKEGTIYKSEIPWYPLVMEMWEEATREEELSRSSLIAENVPSLKQHKDCLRATARSDTAVAQKRKKMRFRQTRLKNRTGSDANSQMQFVPCTNDRQSHNEGKKLHWKSESSPVMSDVTPCDSIAVPCTKERTVPRNNNDNDINTKDYNIGNRNDTAKSPIQSSMCPPCPWKNMDRELPSSYTVPCPNYWQPNYENENEYNPKENNIPNDFNEAIIPCSNVFQEVQRADDYINACYSPVCTHYNDICYNESDSPCARETEIDVQQNNYNENPTMVKCTTNDVIEDEDDECEWYLQCTIVLPEMNQTQDDNDKAIENCSCEIQAVNDVKQQGTSPSNMTVCTKEIQTANDVKQKGILTNNAVLCTKEIQYCQSNDMQKEPFKEKVIPTTKDAQLGQESSSKSVECFLLPSEKENKSDKMNTVNTESEQLEVLEIAQNSTTKLKIQPQVNKSTLKLDSRDQETDIQGYLAEESNSYSDRVQEGTSVFDMDKRNDQSLLFTIEEEGICEPCKAAMETKSGLESWYRKTSASEILSDCLPCRLEGELNMQLSRLTKTFIDVMECTLRLAVKEEFDKKVSCECSSERHKTKTIAPTNLQYAVQEVNTMDNSLRTVDKTESEIQAVAEHRNKGVSVTPTRREAETNNISALPSSRHVGIQENAKIKLRNVNTQKTGNMGNVSINEPVSTESHKKKTVIQKRDLNLKDVDHEEKQKQHVLKSSENIPRDHSETYTNKERKSRILRSNICKTNWNAPEISIREKSRIFKECCNEELWEDFRCDENCKDKNWNGEDRTKISSIICDDYPPASTCDASLCAILKNVFTNV